MGERHEALFYHFKFSMFLMQSIVASGKLLRIDQMLYFFFDLLYVFYRLIYLFRIFMRYIIKFNKINKIFTSNTKISFVFVKTYYFLDFFL
jgi:hypothetical protein